MLVGAGLAFLSVRHTARASLPRTEGTMFLTGLSAPVVVQRDALGVPTIRGARRVDVAMATGFVHAQERFYQMDLLRRRAAGELAELFGPGVMDADRKVRIYRFRRIAEAALRQASERERDLVRAYAVGVNAGLEDLRARPLEYIVLRTAPEPWKAEDSILVLLAIFLDMQRGQPATEATAGLVRDALPAPLADFLLAGGTEWDAPLVGGPLPRPPLPGPDVVDLRKDAEAAPLKQTASRADPLAPVPGSNNWAVAARRSKHGGALVANDMHLGLGLPNTWYRAALVFEDGGAARRVVGVTLPGTPFLVAGSNGDVAWSFTNTGGDWSDLVLLEPGEGPDTYRTPNGSRPIEHHKETIVVRGQTPEALDVRSTVWGPVLDVDHEGRLRAHAWVPLVPGGVGLGLSELEGVRSVDEALAVAPGAGAPELNLVCADRGGRIAWTVLGRIPRRLGFDGRVPASWADGRRAWDGWLPPDQYPRLVDPPDGLLWTANARVVAGEDLARLGDGGYDLGARARQIRDDLRATHEATEEDLLAIQLDDRAVFLTPWRETLLGVLRADPAARDPKWSQARAFVESWGARASVDSVGYRLVRAFRGAVVSGILEALTVPCRAADARFDVSRLPQRGEGVAAAVLAARPDHLLPPRFRTWDEVLLAAADAAFLSMGKGPLANHTWGEANVVTLQHPMGRAVPFLAPFFDLPPRPLPGDSNMPRVQLPGHGASERFVVSPGREDSGIFHMPGGQSGHPLSPHYRDAQEAWEAGRPTPFLPGPTEKTLTLQPAGSAR